MSSEDSFMQSKHLLFFFAPWVWRGTLLASEGIVLSLFALCVGVMERAGERRTQRNVACSLNRWGLFTPSKSTLTIARNVRYLCLCEKSHNVIFPKCFNVLIFNHGCVGMLSGCGRFSGCLGFFSTGITDFIENKISSSKQTFYGQHSLCLIYFSLFQEQFNPVIVYFHCKLYVTADQTLGVAVSHQR